MAEDSLGATTSGGEPRVGERPSAAMTGPSNIGATIVGDAGPVSDRSVDSSDGAREAPQLTRGAVLGRYLVLERIGAGGMGEVYAVYDPELNRKVAIKLLHPERRRGAAQTGGAPRLLREAQAMAQLTDPHVITVHDVGTFGDQVFVAMEFVDGRTLAEWLVAAQPDWRQVLEVMIKAGKGLAAAHAAEIIHRDFKPDNVLMGDDGRVVVADFGLARAAAVAARSDLPTVPSSASLQSSTLGTSMTRTGALMGTPAYMSPEAYTGGQVDARSDQFSYCVALYEALYHERPYAGEDLASLAFAVLEGDVREPPPGAKVPGWLRRVVLRGLCRDPQGRYPSMAALIEELRRDVSAERRRLRWGAGIVGLTLVVGAAVGLAVWGDDEDRDDPRRQCVAAQAQLEGVWDGPRKRAIEEAIEATGISYGAQTWRVLERTLDAYTGEWLAMHRAACEATHVRKEQSARILDLQVACLGVGLDQLRGLTQALEDPNHELLASAEEMAVGLPGIARCGDTQALAGGVALPEDPTVRAQVDAVRRRLATITALNKAQRIKVTTLLTDELVTRAEASGYPPVLAEALYQRGVTRRLADIEEGAEEDLSQGLAIALASGHHEYVARAALALLHLMSGRQNRLREAKHWEQIARAAIEASGGDQLLESDVLIASSRRLAHTGEFDTSLERAEMALAIRAELFGPDHLNLAAAIDEIGYVYYMREEIGAMRRTFARSLRILEGHYGAGHPALETPMSNLAVGLLLSGEASKAAGLFDRLWTLRAERLGPDHIVTVDARSNLASALLQVGRYAEAEVHFRAVLEVYTERYGADNPSTGEAEVNLAAAMELRDPEASRAHYLRSLEIFEKETGDGGRRLAGALHRHFHIFGDELGRAERLALLRRGVELSREVHGDDDPRAIEFDLDFAQLDLEAGNYDAAMARLVRRVAELEAAGRDGSLKLVRLNFLVGRAHFERGEHERGMREILAAAKSLDEGTHNFGIGHGDDLEPIRVRAEIKSWIAAHDPPKGGS